LPYFPKLIHAIWATSSIFRQHYNTGICSGLQIFQKSGTHIQILGARKVTWNVSHNEGPQVWSDLWTSLISGAFCSMHASWYTFLYARGKRAVIMLNGISCYSMKFSHPGFLRLTVYAEAIACVITVHDGHSGANSGGSVWTLARQKGIAFLICILPTSGWEEWNISSLLRSRRITSFESHFSETFPYKRANNRRVALRLWRRVVSRTASWYAKHLTNCQILELIWAYVKVKVSHNRPRWPKGFRVC
jgi:hypothetical protein